MTLKDPRMTRREFLRWSAYVGLGLLVTACSPLGGGADVSGNSNGSRTRSQAGSGGASSANGDPILVGLMPALTGLGGPYGEQAQRAAIMAQEYINSQGGVLGGRPIELRVLDNQSKPELVPRLMTQFAEEGCSVVLGGTYSPVTVVAAQRADELNIPLVCPIEVADEIIGDGREWVFKIPPNASDYAAQGVVFAHEVGLKTGHYPKKVVVLYSDTNVGTIIAGGYQRQIEEFPDMELLDVISYNEETTSDMVPVLTRIRSMAPDVIFFFGNPKGSILFVQAMEQLRYSPTATIGTLGGNANVEFLQTLGEAAEHDLTVAYWTPHMKFDAAPGGFTPQQVYDQFLQKYNAPMDGVGIYYFSAMGLIADVIERAGSTDRSAIREALRSTDIEAGRDKFGMFAVAHGVKFGPGGQNEKGRGVVTQVRNGKFEAVYPEEFANAELIWPRPSWG